MCWKSKKLYNTPTSASSDRIPMNALCYHQTTITPFLSSSLFISLLSSFYHEWGDEVTQGRRDSGQESTSHIMAENGDTFHWPEPFQPTLALSLFEEMEHWEIKRDCVWRNMLKHNNTSTESLLSSFNIQIKSASANYGASILYVLWGVCRSFLNCSLDGD